MHTYSGRPLMHGHVAHRHITTKAQGVQSGRALYGIILLYTQLSLI